MIHLTVSSLYKKYGAVTALSDLSFQATSDIIGISGHNGSGKSTLLKCLAGLLKPTRGEIHWKFDGVVNKKEDLRQHLGFSAPYINLYEEFTVTENLQFIIELRNRSNTRKIPEILEYFDCLSFKDSLFGSLSTGQQQRSRLAAATLHDPEVLLLDEPGSNLDQQGRNLVKKISELYRGRPQGMLIIASNQKEELDLCNQIIDLNRLQES